MFLIFFFCNRILSYFAKPNIIIHYKWFNDNLEKTNFYLKNKKIKTIPNMHEFFFEQSNYKIGASENNLQIDSDENREELFNNYYVEDNSEKYDSISNKKFLFIEKIPRINLNFLLKRT